MLLPIILLPIIVFLIIEIPLLVILYWATQNGIQYFIDKLREERQASLRT